MRFRCGQAGRQAGNRVGRRSTLLLSVSPHPSLSLSLPFPPFSLDPSCAFVSLFPSRHPQPRPYRSYTARVLGRARKCAKNSFVAIGRMEALFAHLWIGSNGKSMWNDCESRLHTRKQRRPSSARLTPPRPRAAVRLHRARGGVYAPRARTWLRVLRGCACVCVCVCGRDAFPHTHVCGKKSGLARGWAGGRGRQDVDIFLRATRECRERHAFDWPGVVGAAAGETMGRGWEVRATRGRGGGGRGWRGWSTLCRRFFGAFFYGRRPSLAWMNEHGEEHQ